MPRFVLLRHDFPPDFPRASHWDLMLESGDVLRTWALAELPDATRDTVDAQQLADHRLAYLDYEGPISGDRGSVRQADRGEFESVAQAENCWLIKLQGRTMRGQITLRRVQDDRWTLKVEDVD